MTNSLFDEGDKEIALVLSLFDECDEEIALVLYLKNSFFDEEIVLALEFPVTRK